jgi:hypothetical protein
MLRKGGHVETLDVGKSGPGNTSCSTFGVKGWTLRGHAEVLLKKPDMRWGQCTLVSLREENETGHRHIRAHRGRSRIYIVLESREEHELWKRDPHVGAIHLVENS